MQNPDDRTQRLRRALSADPGDVEVQHALLASMARSGELPPEAVERAIPGRPIMPWQFVPVSYLLLEAERIGRATEWAEGRVEAEWITGVRGAQPGSVPIDGASTLSLSRAEAPPKFYVGLRSTRWRGLQVIAGVPLDDLENDERGPEQFARRKEMIPARWIPALGLNEGCWAEEDDVRRLRRYLIRDRSIPRFYAEEIAEHGLSVDIRHDCRPRPQPQAYAGPYPDLHEPQVLLYAAPRYSTMNKDVGREQQWRSLGYGPLLDVRLIKRARIMIRRGRAWKNPRGTYRGRSAW